jgi:hypothetical protein
VRETREDTERLQRLIDEGRASAGAHMRRIFTEERTLDAARLAARLDGIQVLHLATVTARGEPRVSPVDGIFFRGHFHFGTAPDSMRARHLAARPACSATVTHGEDFCVIVHGRAAEVDVGTDPVRAQILDLYVPRYGAEWEAFMDAHPYWRIEPERLFCFMTSA